jgi:hypothetical protein
MSWHVEGPRCRVRIYLGPFLVSPRWTMCQTSIR